MRLPQTFDVSSKLATAACYAGPAVMAAADTLTTTLNRTFDPLKQTISGYAAGSNGWLEKLGMEMVALSFFFIAVNFNRFFILHFPFYFFRFSKSFIYSFFNIFRLVCGNAFFIVFITCYFNNFV